VRHAARAELVWFNSAHMFHVAGHVPAVRDALRALHGEADLPRHAFFADGGTIPDAMIEHIRAVFAGCARPVRWQAQDVLLVDNVRLAHGREPFKGPRTIHVVLTDAESTAAAGARG
jgi:hypothetical protein